ncbi:MAG: RluA family pseudouridine synthase [Rhodospirillales bacterium]|nr:MAG: RluA family pseudouridine synthase [Rhodospirillales bacterium]
MHPVETRVVAEGETGLRLDRWFRRHFPDIAHGRLERWLRSGQVRVDGRRAKAGSRLSAGQRIRIPPHRPSPEPRPVPRPVSPDPHAIADLEARVLYEDEAIIALNKPAGLAVQGGTGTRRHLDALLPGLSRGGEAPRLVHRLDKDTSGVLVVARTRMAAASLARAFRSRATRKLYWAIVVGVPDPPAGRIDLPLAKHAGGLGERMRPDQDQGLRAITDYRVVARAGRHAAWLALEPVTGRTHQLRVHCAAIGTPILGDGKYGGAAAFPGEPWRGARVHLHARAISLPHPGGALVITAPLPPDLLKTWDFLGFDNAEAGDESWP